MKKIISLILILIMSSALLVGCGNDEESIVGKDAAMLLLANERLNKSSLDSNGNIFTASSQVFKDLSEKAVENISITVPEDQYKISYSTLKSGASYPVLSLADRVESLDAPKAGATPLGSFGDEKQGIGKMEIVGDKVIFSDFEEVSNSYEYFLNYTNNIVVNAEVAADLIDYVKKNIRVVDKWVQRGYEKYYLHVGENEEIMCRLDTEYDMLDICRRYKNEEGVDVYEIYREQPSGAQRITYIPGQRYEFSHGDQYFVADNSKGYWINYVLGDVGSHYNISYLVLKDDICFTFGVDSNTMEPTGLQVLSADRETDIVLVSGGDGSNEYRISLCAFNGVKSIEVPKSDVSFGPDNSYANCSGSNNIVVKTESGKTIGIGRSNSVQVIAIDASCYAYGYSSEMFVSVSGETEEARFNTLISFLESNGLTCRRNINGVKSGYFRAVIDRDGILKYYKWNGENVSAKDGIARAIANEKTRFHEMKALYEDVKNKEVIDYNNKKAMELNMSFPDVMSITVNGASLSANKISVSSITLKVDDTALIVENEAYKVVLALQSANGGLVHLEQTGVSSNQYSGEGSFTASASDISLDLPMLEAGAYKLVAYIATSDGIRSSKSVALSFGSNSVSGLPIASNDTELTASVSGGALVLTYTSKLDVYRDLTSEDALSFADFDKTVRELAFDYGYTDGSSIEIKGEGGAYTVLSNSASTVPDGEYRIKYSVVNGSSVKSGYIYISYERK